MAANMKSWSTAYVPLDELLGMRRVRILRMLNRFDWVTADELRIALDVREDDTDAHNTQMSRFVALGAVKRRGTAGSIYASYRLSPAGRRELRNLLGRAEIRDTEAIA